MDQGFAYFGIECVNVLRTANNFWESSAHFCNLASGKIVVQFLKQDLEYGSSCIIEVSNSNSRHLDGLYKIDNP